MTHISDDGTDIRVAWPEKSVFVTVEAVRASLRDGASVRLLDARAEAAYLTGHLPHAVSLPARDLNVPVGGIRRLIDAEALRKRLADLRIGAGPVVVYGARGGSDAAHVWWTLHAYRHPAVYLLDGGFEAWQAAGEGVTTALPELAPTGPAFAPSFDADRAISLAELSGRLSDPGLALLDTRSPGEYYGVDVAAARGGRIPGASLLPWDETLDQDLELKPRKELRELLKPFLEAKEVATYCQSGVRAAHTYAVLKELGHARPRLYLESWGEWGNTHDAPVER